MNQISAALLLLTMGAVGCGGASSVVHSAESSAAPEVSPALTSPPVTAEGYGDTWFVAAGDGVDRVVAGDTEPLVRGIGSVTALLRNGGTLVAATEGSLFTVSLRDAQFRELAPVGGAVALVLDPQGYYVASFADRAPVRVTGRGDVTPLDGAPPGPARFDGLSLVVARGAGDARIDYLSLVGEDPAEWAARQARPMRPFSLPDGVGLTSAEYWPNRGEEATRYPEDVLWGFYPEAGVAFEGEVPVVSATPEAVACAEASYAALRAWLEERPESFDDAVAAGASPRFYLWINDYSEASESFSHDVRPARLWYWEREPAVPGRIPGYWKWETTLTRGGECQIPEAAQAESYLEAFER